MPPLVSVIIPTYYRNDRLEAAVESVAAQGYDAIELVVVDDSGEGHAEGIARRCLQEFDRGEYVAHDANEGAHAARDTGARHASGEYVQFLDDDDRLLPEKIERQVAVLESLDDTDVVYCGLAYEDGASHSPDPDVRGDVLEDCLRFYDHPLTTSTMLIDATALAEIRPLNRASAGADDIRMSIELARRTRFEFVEDILVRGGTPDDSRGTSWGGVRGRWEIIEEFADLYDRAPPDVRRSALAETYQLQGRRHLEDRWWSAAAIYAFGQALRYEPDRTPLHVGEFLASIAGRPGRTAARRIVQASAIG